MPDILVLEHFFVLRMRIWSDSNRPDRIESKSTGSGSNLFFIIFFQVGKNSPLWPECLTATLRTTRAHWAFFGTLKIATSRGASLRWLCAKKFAARTSFWATARFSLRWCAMPPRSRPAFSMTFTRLRLVEGTFYFYQ